MIAVGAGASLMAFGATFLGTALLLMFNPASRAVRWYAAFNIVILMWLGAQGYALITAREPADLMVFQFAVHMLPAVFLASALGQSDRGPGAWAPAAVVVIGLLLFVPVERADWSVGRFWHIGLWCSAAGVYVWRALRGRGRRVGGRRASTRNEKVLEVVLSAFVPIGVTGAIIAQGSFVLVVLPLLTVAVMLLIFSGVVFHRYYDIEVRAARTGELATAAAEHDRLALLGELSATIAHEVRNPLTGIRSLTQMIAEPAVTEEKRIRYAGVILDEVGRLDRIVGNLTDLARSTTIAAPSGETILASLFDDLRLLVDARARRVRVEIVVDPTAVVMHAPREALAQALLNLLLNAIAHAPPGTAVTMSADANGSETVIHVADQGPGVAAAERERIFQPFTTRGGTGLGLAVVRRLADEHGWKVTVADAPGGGALFSIHVPDALRAE